jgi:cytochrome b561
MSHDSSEQSETISVSVPISVAATEPNPPLVAKSASKLDICLTTRVRRVLALIFAFFCVFPFLTHSLFDVFQYHPLAMTLSFVALFPEMMHVANNFRRCRNLADRNQTMTRHLVIGLLMKAFALSGFIAIEFIKFQKQKVHFKSWHGKIGLLCILTLSLQVLVGCIYQYRLLPQSLSSWMSTLRKAHKWIGLSLLFLASLSMYLGMQTHHAQRVVTNDLLRFVLGIAPAVLVLSAYRFE